MQNEVRQEVDLDLKLTRRGFVCSVTVFLFSFVAWPKSLLARVSAESEFYDLSCILTGFDELDRTFNRNVLSELERSFTHAKVLKMLQKFKSNKNSFLKDVSPETKLFRERVLMTWYSGTFSFKSQHHNPVALGYLKNLTWASYSIPPPGIPLPNWDKPNLGELKVG